MLIEIKEKRTSRIIVAGEYESVRDCLEKNRRGVCFESADLVGSDLVDANFAGSNLNGADLRYSNFAGSNLKGADLRYTDLAGIKGYANSHDIFSEIVSRQKVELFSDYEWVAIARIIIYRLCWDSIRMRFGDVMPIIFKKLADAGFGEWLEHWENGVG